jgi:large subunit ribosomal protein L32
MARILFAKFKIITEEFRFQISRIVNQNYLNRMTGFEVSLANQPGPLPCPADSDSKSGLEGLFDGIFWAAVPKKRRSRERQTIRQFGCHKIRAFMTPKKNIKECLECGSWHEAHAICGVCYQKVRDETEYLKSQMDEETRLYKVPPNEVEFVYKDEEKNNLDSKYVVEVKKSRPEWFPKNLLTKGHLK